MHKTLPEWSRGEKDQETNVDRLHCHYVGLNIFHTWVSITILVKLERPSVDGCDRRKIVLQSSQKVFRTIGIRVAIRGNNIVSATEQTRRINQIN